MTVYELNIATETGGTQLFATLEAAKERATAVYAHWKTQEWAKEYEFLDSLTWVITEHEHDFINEPLLSAWQTMDHPKRRPSFGGGVFTITEREVLA